jgi:excisionase family DNA binding protein
MPPGGRRGARDFTTAEAGRTLGFSASRVRQLIAEGRLQARRPGRDYILSDLEVRRFARAPKLRRGRPPKSSRKRKDFRVR